MIGLLYLRARYYDPNIGRFITPDTYTGTLNDPLSQNLYAYCGNNPVAYVDPSGHLKICKSPPQWATNAFKYIKDSGEQVLKGNYTGKVTVLGTAGQVGLGLSGIDLPADIRDITYDVQNWEWSWPHAGQTGLDAVGLVPLIGAVKYTDEAAALIKGAGNQLPKNYLDNALKQQGLKNAPNGLKQTWTENGYKYEVRVHAGESQYTNANSIYRVSRQQIPTPGTQGTGTQYLGTDGDWYHTSVLRQFNGDGSLNPLYNANAAQITHIPLP